MMTYRIKSVPASERPAAVDILTAAFCSDPAVRWMYPTPAEYFAHFPAFVSAFAGEAFAHSTAQVADGFQGAALWLAPGISPDETALDSLFRRTIPPSRREQLFAVFEQMSSYHPSEAHWHLPLIGVDPIRQRQGCGGALLAHALARCDARGELAYLESSNVANLPLYQKHGFELLGEIRVGSCPPIFPMKREPRALESGARRGARERLPAAA